MPSRRHPSTKPSTPSAAPAGGAASAAKDGAAKDPAAMFAAALKETEARDKAQREKDRQHKEAVAQQAAAERAHADALAQARRDLDRAIAGVRAAKTAGRSTVEADAAWKAAKARVIELETGTAPSWAPPASAANPTEGDTDSDAAADPAADGGDESPVDAGPVGEEQS
jgi:hypothetical protein